MTRLRPIQFTTLPHLIALSVVLIFGGFAPRATAQPPATTIEVATGFSQAIAVTHAADGSGRLFVLQQSGEIRIWDGTSVLTTPFLDLSALTMSGGEQGLLGLAFHPDYPANGLFYVNYTDLAGDTVIARYAVSPSAPNVADPGSATTVLGFAQPFANHNGGDLHFGPDDLLYISSGDGGDFGTAQDSSNLLGNILRIDVDGDDFPADPARNYAIPPDNPFVGVSGAAEEIWALGLRNPWRFSFDRLTGDVFIGDVGEGEREEIDLIPASASGFNLGWPCLEGSLPFMPGIPECTGGGPFVDPILELPHDDPPNNNCSIIGGYRYRGWAFSRLRGWYFYTDWCTGLLWAAEPDGTGAWTAELVEDIGAFTFTGFGESENGELYIAGGFSLRRVVDMDGTDPLFTDGFEGGDTSAWDSTVP